ncbi:CcoQ/FixQ family Cbb3-type cytochrome c oxidase assembly chaperone [Sphingobacteriaceae bacterium]|nr:CcoQ/FixQ family Cbb3-type cytochrome c oxidase assembly chaperone [Sphingobacteriaceae bacterium]
MKFINYLESITGIGFYPLASFLIFFLFFLAVTIYVIRTGKTYFDVVAAIPLDTKTTDSDYENN